jgi:hypothetical protein
MVLLVALAVLAPAASAKPAHLPVKLKAKQVKLPGDGRGIQVTARTPRAAHCKLRVKSGTYKATKPRVATDLHGVARWSWRLSDSAPSGIWHLTANCAPRHGRSGHASTKLRVQAAATQQPPPDDISLQGGEQPGPDDTPNATFDGFPAGLRAGQADALHELRASTGQYRFVMQDDGNLVLYLASGRALWSSGTAGHPGSRAVMQGDGNLVVYSPSDEALWNSQTAGHPNARLVLQDDGNVVIYDGTKPLWNSATVQTGLLGGDVLRAQHFVTAPAGRYRLVMQGDGNLVLYTSIGRAIWSSKTQGNPGARAVMQGDGNLVVYSSGDQALWNSGTAGQPGSRLAVQDDGNLVVYKGSTPLWASHSVDGRLVSGETLASGQTLYSSTGAYLMTMQGDGNLVLQARGGRVLWNAGTNGHPGSRAVMQDDGNFVVYSPSNQALWNSGTGARSAGTMIVQDDGNAVVYIGTAAVWNTNTVQGGSTAGSPVAESAAAWAEGHLGQTYSNELGRYWSGWCEAFAELSYGRRFNYASAIADYTSRRNAGQIHGGVPPRGALVFYGGGGGYGHVAISTGGGYVVGTLGFAGDHLAIGRTPYTYFSNPYYGWAMPY